MNPSLTSGHAAWFHHLHENRPAKRVRGPDDSGEYAYAVEGKSRPMLIIRWGPRVRTETATRQRPTGSKDCYFYEVKARLGYLVLWMGGSNPPPTEHYLEFRNLLGDGKRSYVDLRPQIYPAESLERECTPVPIESKIMGHIYQEITMKKLGMLNKWHRG
jgi:hypothetical protein